MRKRFLSTTIFLVIFFVVILILLQNYNAEKQGRVCFEDKCFRVELALTAEKIKKGLMFRKELGRDQGMLFVFPKEAEYPFWMKNTLIPLDIIWINQDREVVFISEHNQPCNEDFCFVIDPIDKAKYVLEVNDGIVKEINLVVGDKVSIEY